MRERERERENGRKNERKRTKLREKWESYIRMLKDMGTFFISLQV